MTDTYRSAGFRAPDATRPGRPKKAASREQFLDAAVQLFSHQGVSATTLAHIARAVGVTSAMVHYHFASREQLIDAVVGERILPFLNGLWLPVTAETVQDPVATLHGLAERILNGALVLPWLAPMWLSDIGSTAGELRQRVMQHLPAETIIALTESIQQAQQRGEIEPQLQAHMIFPTLVGLVLVPLASLDTCHMLHESADFSTDALRRHVTAVVHNFLRPQ